jgi:hypothetical protein
VRFRDPGGPSARIFVAEVSDWLAPPSQIADLRHVFMGCSCIETDTLSGMNDEDHRIHGITITNYESPITTCFHGSAMS